MHKNLFFSILGIVFGVIFLVCYAIEMPRIQLLLVSMLLPLVGVVLRSGKAVGCVGLFFGAKWFLCGGLPITFGLPSACAAANWSLHAQQGRNTELIRFCLNVLLPIVCMLLFVLHQAGNGACFYSLYWLIPVTAYFAQFFFKHSVLLVALSSTFIAHAVGSVMWLYLVPMPPERWIALIPAVAVERLGITAGEFLVYCVIGHFALRAYQMIPGIAQKTAA